MISHGGTALELGRLRQSSDNSAYTRTPNDEGVVYTHERERIKETKVRATDMQKAACGPHIGLLYSL